LFRDYQGGKVNSRIIELTSIQNLESSNTLTNRPPPPQENYRNSKGAIYERRIQTGGTEIKEESRIPHETTRKEALPEKTQIIRDFRTEPPFVRKSPQ
jgi:hypothetical protein